MIWLEVKAKYIEGFLKTEIITLANHSERNLTNTLNQSELDKNTCK